MSLDNIKQTYKSAGFDLSNINKNDISRSLYQDLTFHFYYNREVANSLYKYSCIDKKMAIIYNPISKDKFNKINDGKVFEINEFTREFKGFKFDVNYWWGGQENCYGINCKSPDGRIEHITFNSHTIYPMLYDKPFGIEYEDYIEAQKGMIHMLKTYNIDTSNFTIDDDINKPYYFFIKSNNLLICVPKFLKDSNIELESCKKTS